MFIFMVIYQVKVEWRFAMKKVAVRLAVCNGANYLAAAIDSILAQSWRFRLPDLGQRLHRRHGGDLPILRPAGSAHSL
jgi:hypothetical protein